MESRFAEIRGEIGVMVSHVGKLEDKIDDVAKVVNGYESTLLWLRKNLWRGFLAVVGSIAMGFGANLAQEYFHSNSAPVVPHTTPKGMP